jgi:hypothetical protein
VEPNQAITTALTGAESDCHTHERDDPADHERDDLGHGHIPFFLPGLSANVSQCLAAFGNA